MEALLRQKDVMLEEMQHRVANSLQIIASIILMKGRLEAQRGPEENKQLIADTFAARVVQRHGVQVIERFDRRPAELAHRAVGLLEPRPDAADLSARLDRRHGARTSSGLTTSAGSIARAVAVLMLPPRYAGQFRT